MNPDQAATLIAQAIGPDAHPVNSQAFAHQLALALNAISLLAFASDPELKRERDVQGAPPAQPWAAQRQR